jgi:hypothetical protein
MLAGVDIARRWLRFVAMMPWQMYELAGLCKIQRYDEYAGLYSV